MSEMQVIFFSLVSFHKLNMLPIKKRLFSFTKK